LLIVLLAMVPALGFQAYTELQARRARQQLVADEALRLVRLVKSQQQRIVEGAREVLNVISGDPAVQDNIPALCQRLLGNLVRESPRYTSAGVIGRDAHPICAASLFDASIDVSDRAFFRLAMQTGGFVAGEYSVSRVTGKSGIQFARPFTTGDGTVGGVVEVGLSTDWLGGQLEGLGLPPGSTASITDRNGTILARTPNGSRFVGQPIPPAYRFVLDGDEVGVAEMTSREGRPMIVGFAPPGAAPDGLLVTVGLDREVTFAAMARADRIGLMLIVLGVALAITTTIALGQRLIGRPVNQLFSAAEQWRSGALAARTGLREDASEFGRLGAAFDGMAAALAEREQASRASDAALRQLTEDLETRVQVEVAAREAAQARASHGERMQALGQLAGGIAHDFNNVLQAITAAATLIERHANDDPGVRHLVRLVIDAGGRGAAVTRRLLAFARHAELRAEAFDAAALLNSLGEIFAHTLGSAIERQIIVEDGLAPFLADKGQLETVLVNLATNARDAMPGGGRLTLSAAAEVVSADGPMHPAKLAPGRYVRLAVADTGVGMDAATLARADELFFTTKAPGAGTGLGLAMARGFAEQSGGALAIESSQGAGTTVTLWLPEADPDTRAGAAAPPDATQAAPRAAVRVKHGTRVLVVDDDDPIREILAEHLQDAGYDVLVAANGKEALALLAVGPAVDALVTDLSMPGIDGLALIRAARERRPRLPAVLLTGYAGDTTTLAVQGALSSAFSLLRKPIRGPELTDRLQALLAAPADAV
jgi:signal transduction histidine kinase/ActR/RegA family two-component response regulator